MGRKPNPLIAEHFIRGAKHRSTTNRYSQTCCHCSTLFPTGRPETLFAHLASCPNLTAVARSQILSQMYPNAGHSNLILNNPVSDGQHMVASDATHLDDFDITGLNVLAGVAENAEDLMIDPQITDHGHISDTTSAAEQPISYYSHAFGHSYHSGAPTGTWSFQYPSITHSQSPYQDVSSATTGPASFSAPISPTLQNYSFAPVLTTPDTYISHSNDQTSISFADQHGNDLTQDGTEDDLQTIVVPRNPRSKTRKARQPYDNAKKAHVAEMRHFGVCIRCSRLRKTCNLQRPCDTCSKTVSKTWVGGCTTLTRGQEFTIWHDDNLSRFCETLQKEDGPCKIIDKYLELTYFGDNGHKVCFNLNMSRSISHDEDPTTQEGYGRQFFIDEKADITKEMVGLAIDNQEIIIEAIESPTLYSTVRTAQGLSSEQNADEKHQIWGSGKQSDKMMNKIFEAWLVLTFITSEEFNATSIAVFDVDGLLIDDDLPEASLTNLSTQIGRSVETVIKETKSNFSGVDANVLNQSYKHIFNNLIEMFLILDMVEKYCCFMIRRGCPFVDKSTMLEQAQTLAYKYTYCVQNIQMIPRPTFDTPDKTLVGEEEDKRVNHEVQRVWMRDLCLSEDDLEGCLDGWGDHEWHKPSGRLWAQLFRGLN